MMLTEEHLEHDGQLLGRTARVYVITEPNVEDLDLLGEEAARDELAVWIGCQIRQLADAHVKGQIPRLPQRVLVRGRQRGIRDGRAVQALHDALGEKKVSEEAGDEQVLAEELLEELGVENVPSDGVGYGGEDPVEFAEHGASVVGLARYILEHLVGKAGH